MKNWKLAARVLFAAAVMSFAVAGCAAPRASEGAVSPGSAAPEAPAPAADAAAETKTATWGERYTWADGLAIEVSEPKPCKPSEYSVPENIERAVVVTIRVTNGAKETFDSSLLSVGGSAQHAGKPAESVFDTDGPCSGGVESADILPGKSFEYQQAFAVGKAPGELQLAFQPNFGATKAIFLGRA